MLYFPFDDVKHFKDNIVAITKSSCVPTFPPNVITPFFVIFISYAANSVTNSSSFCNLTVLFSREICKLFTNSFFDVSKIMDITPDAFEPAPRVMSSMIRLVPVERDSLKFSFKRFIFREMFFHRERKLKNNLMEALIEFAKLHDKKLTKKESKCIIEEYQIPKETLNKLMENITNEEYELIYNTLK